MGELDAKPIRGTEGAIEPFFSPSGDWLAFYAKGELKKVSLTGGAAVTITPIDLTRGGTWGFDDNLLFSSFNTGLSRIAATGGEPVAVTRLDSERGERTHRWPALLPGGDWVLVTILKEAITSFSDGSIEAISLETGERRVLVDGGTYARYSPTGHLVYAREGRLIALPFDLSTVSVSGPPVVVVEDLVMFSGSGAAEYALSETGTLAYVPGREMKVERTLVWASRTGLATSIAEGYMFQTPRLSPQGDQVTQPTIYSLSGPPMAGA